MNLQAAKTNYERELATKEEQAEEARRNLIKQLRDLEAQLEDERKQRSVAQSAQKKIESELNELESQLEVEAKGKEDMQRHYRKAHVSGAEWSMYSGGGRGGGGRGCLIGIKGLQEGSCKWNRVEEGRRRL